MEEEVDTTSVISDFSISGNQQRLESVVSKLKFISKIEPQQKINTTELFIREPGWQTTILRSINPGETRESTLLFLKDTVDTAISLSLLYQRYNDQFHQNILNMLKDALKECKHGLDNLCITYTSDRMYVSKIETLKQIIDTKDTISGASRNTFSVPIMRRSENSLEGNLESHSL